VAQYRYVYTNFWEDPKVQENYTPEDKLFYLYILTNSHTTQIGIYKITKKAMAFELGYSIESVNSLMDRFINHHKLIKYNAETRELAIKNWGKYNLNKGGKPIEDCITKELGMVEDKSFIEYVAENITNDKIKIMFHGTSQDSPENKEIFNDTLDDSLTYRGQKEKEKENKKENNNIYTQETDIKKDEEIISSDEVSSDIVKTDKTPYGEIIELYNNFCKSLPQVKARSKQRDKMIKYFWKRMQSIKNIQAFFIRIEKSGFLTGRNGIWQNCNFDWIIKESNSIKILEGNYDNKSSHITRNSNGTVSTFNNFEHRNYNFQELEEQIVEAQDNFYGSSTDSNIDIKQMINQARSQSNAVGN
jgi:hypothetical protein